MADMDQDDITYNTQQLDCARPMCEDEQVKLRIFSESGETKWLSISHAQFEKIATILTGGTTA